MSGSPRAVAEAARTALVTGADGVVGSWLVRALLARGDRVVLLRRSGARRSALALDGTQERCAIVTGDLLDATAVDRALAEHGCDTVLHLGAQSIVGTASASPVATFEVNVAGTWNLLEACRLRGVRRVVVASSDKAYGSADALPYTEEHPLRARYPYDVSKACADLIARSYFHTYGLPVAVMRLPNVYGGGDLEASRLIPELIGAILAGRAPVIRSDGSPRRDFLYAGDAAAAYLAIVDALDAGTAGGEAFNAGSGTSHAVRSIVEALIDLAGADVVAKYTGTGTPAGEIEALWLDASKLRATTGWAPAVDLREGLRLTLDWYRAHPEALPA
jgi:CDP-glucose 4,6-dehydratase